MRALPLLLALLVGCRAVTLFPWGDQWTYTDAGVDLTGTGWQTYFFNDAAWSSGYGAFSTSTGGTLLKTGPTTSKFITYYFRKVRGGGRWGGAWLGECVGVGGVSKL